jgi:hypothetical protein
MGDSNLPIANLEQIEALRQQYKAQAKAAVKEAYQRGLRDREENPGLDANEVANLRKESFDKGVEAGKKEILADAREGARNAYQRGLEEGKALAPSSPSPAGHIPSSSTHVGESNHHEPNLSGKAAEVVDGILLRLYRGLKGKLNDDSMTSVKMIYRGSRGALVGSTEELLEQCSANKVALNRNEVAPSDMVALRNLTLWSDAPEAHPLHTIFQVRVPRAAIVRGGMLSKGFVTYSVCGRSWRLHDRSEEDCKESDISCSWRLRDFEHLLSGLREEFPYALIPSLPCKKKDGEKKNTAMRQRRRQLEMWLYYVTTHGELQTSHNLKSFFEGSDDFKATSRCKGVELVEKRLDSEISRRQILTVQRDLSQLKAHYHPLSQVLNRYQAAVFNLTDAYARMREKVRAVQTAEKTHVLKSNWAELGLLLSTLIGSLEKKALVIVQNLCDHFQFFGENCLTAAEALHGLRKIAKVRRIDLEY